MVLDPVDGSDNFARGIPASGMAVALIPADLPISVGTVQFALVGDLFTGNTWLAARGRGAFSNGAMVRTRSVTRPEDAMISCELNHFAASAPLVDVLSRARGVRALGSATRALSMVAAGALDAHLDLRGRLTPENFLGPSLILTEAEGSVTDPEGKPLPAFQRLTERYSILAAATPELHAALVQQLKVGHAHGQ
jgi:myo-inositol-1(or 4)-monophosphatase